MVEVLAPAGGEEQLIAAVRCGADAVYLGAGGFNARRNAENFGGGRLADAVRCAHVRGVKVHVTVNTLVMDAELDELDDTVREIARAGADAVIVQDLAVNAAFRDTVPALPRHASTQMTVHNLDGAKLAADLGFSRVVLARELTLKEIEFITARCGIETEVFIHGALCMCASGQCELSAILGGRSGNRGLCAQPCRLDFHNGERAYALSLKDMSHLKYAQELADAGVASFKIEGRMKRPEYVAAAVTATRAALRGEPYDEEALRAVFSRSGFTDGYLTGKRDTSMFGAREKEDVTAASAVLGKLAALYRAERQSVPVSMDFALSPAGSSLALTDGTHTVSVAGPAPEPAVNRPLDGDAARRSLTKTGGTPYAVERFDARLTPGLTLPVSSLNALRREAVDRLTEARSQIISWEIVGNRSPIPAGRADRAGVLRGRFEKLTQVCCTDALEKVILPLTEVEKHPEVVENLGDKLVVELPSLFFDRESGGISGRLAKISALGVKNVLCETLYAVKAAGDLGFTLHGGAGLNVLNSVALEELRRLGLADATVSFELSMSKIAALGGTLPRGILAYEYLPLMRFRACPLKKRAGCGDCPGFGKLTDRRGAAFPVLCAGKEYGTLLNSVPLHIADKPVSGVDFKTLRFTFETPPQVRAVVEQYQKSLPSPAPRTGALYYRRLL